MQSAARQSKPALLIILRGASGGGKSSVGAALKKLRPNLEILEIDDLKRAAYGSAAKCVPSVDYPKAGALARRHLDLGRDTVVIEPLCDRWHLRSVLSAAGRFTRSPDVLLIWLECSLPVAVERKRGKQDSAFVEWHHRPVVKRDRPRGEVVIDSEQYTPEEISATILGLADAARAGSSSCRR